MSISQRHHYIPQFLIKGFCNSDGLVAVYNKETNTIDRKSPKQIFFEWNRNTFNTAEGESDFVESLYQQFESDFAPAYNRLIKDCWPRTNVNYQDLFHAILFVAITHLRVPSQDSHTLNIINRLSPSYLGFEIKNKSTGNEAPQGFYEEVMNHPAFAEIAKMILAIKNYLSANESILENNWNFYYSGSEIQLQLLGDNPVIFKSEPKLDFLNTELIFPLSKDLTLYHSKHKFKNQLPPEHKVELDILMFLQAKKLVCGPDIEYLKTIAETAASVDDSRKMSLLKRRVFEDLE